MHPVSTADTAIAWNDAWSGSAPVTYPAGAILFRQDEPVRAAFHIVRGAVKTVREESDRDVITSLRLPGWLLGAAAAILRRPHVVSAVTLVESDLRAVLIGDFERMTGESSFASALQRMLAREVYDDALAVGRLGGQSPRERLAGLLSEVAVALPQAEREGCLLPPLKVLEIAQMVGITREHASRLLSELAREGAVRRRAGRLTIPSGSPLLPAARAHDLSQCRPGEINRRARPRLATAQARVAPAAMPR
jgi:CRP-like cAMP-binding protein